MANTDYELLGIEEPKTRKPKKAKELGPLHDLLMRGLPDYMNGEMFDTHKLARTMKVTRAAIYKWFEKNQVPSKRAAEFIRLSEATKNKPKTMQVGGREVKWTPLNREDFWEFITQ